MDNNIGGPIYQVLDANSVDDIKQMYPDFNFENVPNVQFVISDELFPQQVVQMQAPNQPELVVNENPQAQTQQLQQVVYQSPDQNQTYVLQQAQEAQHMQQQVVFQTRPVQEDRVTEQPVSFVHLLFFKEILATKSFVSLFRNILRNF